MGALGEERGRKRNVGGGFGGTPKEEEKEEEKEVCPTKRARAHITIFSSSIFAPFIIFLFLFSVILTFKLPGEKAWKDETAAFLSLFLFLLRLMDRVSVIGFGHLSLSLLFLFLASSKGLLFLFCVARVVVVFFLHFECCVLLLLV